jgi:hypothetical protein
MDGSLVVVEELEESMIRRAMPAVALLLVGPPLPDRSTKRLQTKMITLALQVGGSSNGTAPITGKKKTLTNACNSQRQSKPDGFKRGRLKLRKRIMRVATWNVQSTSLKRLRKVLEDVWWRV